MPASCDLLFAYGTLLPDCRPPALRGLCERLELVGRATADGVMYDLGPFPGVVPGAGVVHGVVLRVPPDAWSTLDDYEGCAPSDDPLFRRVLARARLSTGQELDCWLYVYARDVTARCIVVGGDWLRRTAPAPPG